MPIELPVRARCWLDANGWLEIQLSTEDVPPSRRHHTGLPKIRLQIDGGRPHYLDPNGHMQEEPYS